MLVNELPTNLFAQYKITVRHFEVDEHIPTIPDSFTYCRYKFAWLREMFKYVTTDNEICWLLGVFGCVVVGYKSDIGRNVIARIRLIARTEANTDVIPPIGYDAQKVAFSASDFNNLFLVQVICRDQPV